MANVLNGFTDAQIARLRRVLNAVETGELPPEHGQPAPKGPRASRHAVGILTDPIAAIATPTGTPTVGTLNVYSFSSTGVEDTGVDETVYHFGTQVATTGRWTFAHRDNFTGKWFIDYQMAGRMLKGQLAEHMCTTDASADVDNIVDLATGETVANLTALNTLTLAGRDNDIVILQWDQSQSNWVIIQVQHHLLPVLVDVYVSGTKLKGSYRDIAAMYCGDQREADLEDLAECP